MPHNTYGAHSGRPALQQWQINNLSRGQDIFPNFPFMVLQSRSFTEFVGVEDGLAEDLVSIERAETLWRTPSGGCLPVEVPYQRAIE